MIEYVALKIKQNLQIHVDLLSIWHNHQKTLSYLPKCRDSVWACKKLYLQYKTVDFQLKSEDTKGV